MKAFLIVVIVLAVILGVIGLVVEALQWLLIIAGLLIAVGLVRLFLTGPMARKDDQPRR